MALLLLTARPRFLPRAVLRPPAGAPVTHHGSRVAATCLNGIVLTLPLSTQPNPPADPSPCSCKVEGAFLRDAPSQGDLSQQYTQPPAHIPTFTPFISLPSPDSSLPSTDSSPQPPPLCPNPETPGPRHRAHKAQVRPDLQPERVPPLSDDPREPGQTSGVHFDPLMEVVPSRAPRPVVEVVLIDTCLERDRCSSERPPEPLKIEINLS